MLSLRILPRNINYCLKQSSQQLHTSFKLLSVKDPSSSSSSSSSDSSDSDSDKENQLQKQIPVKEEKDTSDVQSTSNTNTRLNALLQKITESTKNQQSADATKVTNTLNVALKPTKERFKKTQPKLKKEEPFGKQLKDAAKNVAKVIKGDSDKTELELLSKALNIDKASTDTKDSPTSTVAAEKAPAPSSSLGDLLTGMKIERSAAISDQRMQMASKLAYSKEPSVAHSLLYTKSRQRSPRNFPSSEPELKAQRAGLGIFKEMSEQENKDIPQLSTWQDMEKKEIKLAGYRSPQNVFQELILWTEQGKIWNFPINNEQGMEKEEEVHFSEHVFLERHLKGWCPKKGPIRHFMELVCTGLSKNPYMTVEEKFEHITWYKTYFEDKKDLLIELGVADNTEATGVATEKKKEITA